MSKAKHIIGAVVHGPERFDELAERIARTDLKIDSVVREDSAPFVRKMLMEASEDKDWLAKVNHELSISPTLWGDPEKLDIDESASVYTCFFNTNSGRIRIGRYTFAGSRVSILAGSHDPELTGLMRRDAELTEGCDISIGNGVWLGSGCTVLGPCEIGDNAVIAAGAVVIPKTEVPANTVWGGVPARQIGVIEPADGTDPEAPAVQRAFSRSNGALFADGWGERSYRFPDVPGHRLIDETGTVLTDRAAWKLCYRKETAQSSELRMEGPAGEETVILSGREGSKTVKLPAGENGISVIRFKKAAGEKIYIALAPAEETEEAENEPAEAPAENEEKESGEAEAPETAEAAEQAEAGGCPAGAEGEELNIEAIMEEIREEVRRNGPYESLPDFDGVPIEQKVNAKFLRDSIDRLTGDYTIPVSFEDPSRNPVKRIYKKAVKKIVRCSTAPMAIKATEVNLGMKTALENAAEVIARQQTLIDELTRRVEQLEQKNRKA